MSKLFVLVPDRVVASILKTGNIRDLGLTKQPIRIEHVTGTTGAHITYTTALE